jgi:hypothetical protein
MHRANGSYRHRKLVVLPEIGPVDGRTRPAILYKEVAAAIVADLGGLNFITRAQRELVKRASGLAVLADRIEEELVNGRPVDLSEYTLVVNSQARVLRVLGIERIARDVTPPDPLAYAKAIRAQHGLAE